MTLHYTSGPNYTTLLSDPENGVPTPVAADLLHDGHFQPIHSPADLATLDMFKTRFGKYRADIEAAAAKFYVPAPYLFGIAWAESFMNPDLVTTDTRGFKSYGLFQISDAGIRGGVSDEDIVDPEINAEKAAKFIQSLYAGRRDLPFPQIASMYGFGRSNAQTGDIQNGVVIPGNGAPAPVRANNMWGLAEPRDGFIMDAVRGANTAIALSEDSDSSLGIVLGLGAAALVAFIALKKRAAKKAE